MIDVKAIKAAAEAAESRNWAHGANPATVVALCDEIERLRMEVEADERNLCQLTDELDACRKDAEKYRLRVALVQAEQEAMK